MTWFAHCVNYISHDCPQAPSGSKLRTQSFIMDHGLSSSRPGRLSDVHRGQSMDKAPGMEVVEEAESLGLRQPRAIIFQGQLPVAHRDELCLLP